MNKGRRDERSIAAIIIPTMLAIIAVASMLLFQTQTVKLTQEQAYRSLTDSALEQTATLREILNGRFVVLEAFANSLANQKSAPDIEDITARMDAIVQTSDFTHMAVAGLDGVAYTNDGQRDDSSDRAYMSEALTGRRTAQKLTDSRLYQKCRIVLAVPL